MGDAALPRLVAATDGGVVGDPRFWDRLDALLGAGLPALWLRWVGGEDRALQTLAERARRNTAERNAELWIGGRPDVARAVGADAVQLPEGGVSIGLARRVVSGAMRVGCAVHSVAAARAAVQAGAQQLVVGTIYASRSHPGVEPAGPERIQRVRQALEADARRVPCYAIGGIEAGNVEAVLAAGAFGVASIGALWRASDPEAAVRGMIHALDRALARGE